MYKITLPMNLDGYRYGLKFFKGVAETDNEILAIRLKNRGLSVEILEIPEEDPNEDSEDLEIPEEYVHLFKLTRAQLRNYAQDTDIAFQGL